MSAPIGTDPRRAGWSPADRARAEAIVARHGGVLEVAPSSTGRLVLTWQSATGGSISVEGPDAAACLPLLALSLCSVPLSLS